MLYRLSILNSREEALLYAGVVLDNFIKKNDNDNWSLEPILGLTPYYVMVKNKNLTYFRLEYKTL